MSFFCWFSIFFYHFSGATVSNWKIWGNKLWHFVKEIFVVQTCPILSKLVKTRQNLYNFPFFFFNFCGATVSNRKIWGNKLWQFVKEIFVDQTCPNLSDFVLTCQNLSELVKTGQNLSNFNFFFFHFSGDTVSDWKIWENKLWHFVKEIGEYFRCQERWKLFGAGV